VWDEHLADVISSAAFDHPTEFFVLFHPETQAPCHTSAGKGTRKVYKESWKNYLLLEPDRVDLLISRVYSPGPTSFPSFVSSFAS